MNIKEYILICFAFMIIFLLSTNCGSSNYTIRENFTDNEYDTQFPSGDVSEFIERIGESVKLINSLVFYKQYHFDWNDKILEKDLQDDYLFKRAHGITNHNRTSSGTATIVGRRENKLLFLTNAHIINFPDTIVSYFSNDSGKVTRYIESVHVKQSQTNYAALVGVSNLDIIYMDEKRDVALVGCNITRPFPEEFRVFDYKIGNSEELSWGDFVYVLGYPMHYKMLTTGIVSIVENESDYFMIDANVNRGASGGLVLAIRDGVPNFELVGIVSLVPSEKKNILAPRSLLNYGRYQIDAKYKGDIIVGEIENVKYGITRIVSVEAIKNSIKENYDEIISQGYKLDSFRSLFDIEEESE